MVTLSIKINQSCPKQLHTTGYMLHHMPLLTWALTDPEHIPLHAVPVSAACLLAQCTCWHQWLHTVAAYAAVLALLTILEA